MVGSSSPLKAWENNGSPANHVSGSGVGMPDAYSPPKAKRWVRFTNSILVRVAGLSIAPTVLLADQVPPVGGVRAHSGSGRVGKRCGHAAGSQDRGRDQDAPADLPGPGSRRHSPWVTGPVRNGVRVLDGQREEVGPERGGEPPLADQHEAQCLRHAVRVLAHVCDGRSGRRAPGTRWNGDATPALLAPNRVR